MKKFLSFLLTFAMLFSLTMPAMAAEPETGKDVTATYNPDIKITGITLSDENYLDGGILVVDETGTHYIYTIDAGVDRGAFNITLEGTNLDMIPDNSTDYLLHISNYYKTVTKELVSGGTFSYTVYDTDAYNYYYTRYSNDGGNTWNYTGWDLLVKQNYFITNATTDTNGTVKIGNGETDLTEVAGGDKVELFVHANDGYELDTLTVMQGETAVEVAADHTFTMPKGDVTVTATFKEATTPNYNITIDSGIVNGTVTVKDGLTQAHAGNDVMLDVTPAEGYQLKELTISYVENGDTKTLTYSDTYTFVMPAADVTITATFEAIKAEITGVAIIIDGVEYNKDKTTSESDPAVIKPDSDVFLKGYGTNLNYATNSNRWGAKGDVPMGSGYSWVYNEDGTEATFSDHPKFYKSLTTARELWFSNDGSLNRSYCGVWIIYEAPTYDVNIGSAVANGTVTATPNPAKEDDTVTVSVEAVAGYAYVVNSIKVINDTTGEAVAVDEASKTFVMPASSVTVTAEFEELSATSVEITWGSLSFTYTDGENGEDGAWSNDGSEGAGTVTVKNTGDTTVTAKATYTAEDDYDEIEGIFDVASKELAATESQTFTLTLKNKPEKAIAAGTKIGSVTITIE